MTDKDKLFIAENPELRDEYLRLRSLDNSENIAQILVLRKAPKYGHIPKQQGGEFITGKEYAAEKKRGFKEEQKRRAKAQDDDSFKTFLQKSGRNDVINELTKKGL